MLESLGDLAELDSPQAVAARLLLIVHGAQPRRIGRPAISGKPRLCQTPARDERLILRQRIPANLHHPCLAAKVASDCS